MIKSKLIARRVLVTCVVVALLWAWADVGLGQSKPPPLQSRPKPTTTKVQTQQKPVQQPRQTNLAKPKKPSVKNTRPKAPKPKIKKPPKVFRKGTKRNGLLKRVSKSRTGKGAKRVANKATAKIRRGFSRLRRLPIVKKKSTVPARNHTRLLKRPKKGVENIAKKNPSKLRQGWGKVVTKQLPYKKKLSRAELRSALRSANKLNSERTLKAAFNSASTKKPGSRLTNRGKQFEKHASRRPQIWGKVKGRDKQKNLDAMATFKKIYRSNGTWKTVTTGQGLNFIEKRLPNGQGIRLNMDKSFKSFLG